MYGGNVRFSVERLHPLRVVNGVVAGPATLDTGPADETGAPGDEK